MGLGFAGFLLRFLASEGWFPDLTMNFRQAFCRKYDVSDGEYCDAVLMRSLYWHARLLWGLTQLISKDFYGPERRLIETLGENRRLSDIRTDVGSYRYSYDLRNSFVRRRLRFRISGRKLLGVAQSVGMETTVRPQVSPE